MTDQAFLLNLQRVVAEASLKARATKRPVLATAVAPCAAFDPLAVFASARSKRRLFWQRPEEDLSLVAVGGDSEIAFDGPGRFQAAKTAWAEHVSPGVVSDTECPLSLPLVLAGFAFSPQVNSATPQSLPAGLLILPRLLFIATKGQFWLSASVRVFAETDIAVAASAVRAEMAALLKDAACTDALARDEAFELEAEADCRTWECSVKALLAEIDAASVEKVVLARAVRGFSRKPIEPAPVLSRLSRRYPQASVFAVASGESCFLGASPERLVTMFGGNVSVDCLAGSTGRGEDGASDRSLAERLLADPKERHEHAVVLRAIKESLAPVCDQVEAPERPSIRQTATVQHLYTPVQAKVREGYQVLDLVERLHPTPATAGYPQREALALIE